jgi:hypothetical protein
MKDRLLRNYFLVRLTSQTKETGFYEIHPLSQSYFIQYRLLAPVLVFLKVQLWFSVSYAGHCVVYLTRERA